MQNMAILVDNNMHLKCTPIYITIPNIVAHEMPNQVVLYNGGIQPSPAWNINVPTVTKH